MRSEVIILDGDERLPQLARKISEAHASCEAQWGQTRQHMGYALEQAMTVGDALNEVKASLNHGQWLPWLAENCPEVKQRQAANYMKLARAAAMGQLEISTDANLSIDQALRLVAAPKQAITANAPSRDISSNVTVDPDAVSLVEGIIEIALELRGDYDLQAGEAAATVQAAINRYAQRYSDDGRVVASAAEQIGIEVGPGLNLLSTGAKAPNKRKPQSAA